MQKIIIIVFTFLFIGLHNVYGQDYGKTELIKIQSKELAQDREIFIYTPDLYNEYTYESYDVIYVFDAQNKSFYDLVRSTLTYVNENDIINSHIVVGITATFIDEPDNQYYRNDDFLPKSNRKKFFNYIQNEIIPYMNRNYRTTNRNIFIGHSLSASFVLSAFTLNSELAVSYIAISPNLAFGKRELINDIEKESFKPINSPKLIYTSFVNEDNGWISSYTLRKELLNAINDKSLNNLKVLSDSIPNSTHWTTVLPSTISGLKAHFNYLDSIGANQPKKIKIVVKVPNIDDDVFISGNQEALGNFQEGKIKLDSKPELIREIELYLTSPADVRFVGGPNKTEAVLKNFDLNYLYHISIRPIDKEVYHFEIIDWKK